MPILNGLTMNNIFLFLLVLFASSSFNVLAESYPPYEPRPSWIQEHVVKAPLDTPLEKIKNGIYYLLVDEQIKASDNTKNIAYFHYAFFIVSQAGLKDASQLNISYDPTYQLLKLHSLMVIRDGKRIDKLKQVKYSLLQREKNLENLIYDGTLTANIIVDDLRVNDVIEYDYSITGSNPVYAGLFSYSFYTQWAVPLKALSVRLVWEKSKPVNFLEINTFLKPEKNIGNGYQEYTYHAENIDPLLTNKQTPSWYDPYGRVQITDTKLWSEVIFWAKPLYDNVTISNAEIKQLVADINKKNISDEEKISAALELTQSKIRYLGIETGVNSHKPSPAPETWQRRYGDCKDKVVLFVTLLNELGFNAYPALVNTEKKKSIADLLPSASAFNHVIAKVVHNNKIYWLDPTRQYQYGKLADLYQPNYGYALVIAAGEKDLTLMAPQNISEQIVTEIFDFSGNDIASIPYAINTQFVGHQAEQKRYSIAGTNLQTIAENYLNFYKGYYPDISASVPVEIQDTNLTSSLSILEKYQIGNILEKDDDQLYANFYASSITSQMLKPDELNRNSPLAIAYPENITQNIQIKLKAKGYKFSTDSFKEDNAYFLYTYDVKYNKDTNILLLSYSYKSKADFVPTDKIAEYLAARKRAVEHSQYQVSDAVITGIDAEVSPDTAFTTYYYVVVGIVYVGLFLFIIFNWRNDSRRKNWQAQSIFYPSSTLKVSILSLLTLGLYSIYWLWMNWVYIKRADASRILPFGRSLFSGFWYFSFYQRLTNGNEIKGHEWLPQSKFIAIFFALFYFGGSLVSSAVESVIGIVGLFINVILVLLMVHQVKKIPQPESAISVGNPEWQLRHYLLLLAFVPITLFSVAQVLGLTPNNQVVRGDSLWLHDINFMQRKKIISTDEKIDLFYSSASFSFREDGNGFTNRSVFSYWMDGGKLVYKNAPFSAISGFELNPGDTSSDHTVLKATLNDGNSIVLYLPDEAKNYKVFQDNILTKWKKIKTEDELKIAFAEKSKKQLYDKNDLLITLKNLILASSEPATKARSAYVVGNLYADGILISQNTPRAIYYYEIAFAAGNLDAGADLAWHLATAENESLRDPKRAKIIIQSVLDTKKSIKNREILAAAYAANNEFDQSIATQLLAISLMKGEVTKIAKLRLEAYQSHRQWIDLWNPDTYISTNVITAALAQPKYPPQALKAGIEGSATVQYDVLASGRTENFKIIESTPANVFDDAAIDALKKSIFFPAFKQGAFVMSHGEKKKFSFVLDEKTN
jgi:TonB family protein